MTEENPQEDDRKSARGRRAKKRDDDVLEPVLEDNDRSPEKVAPAKRKATLRSDDAAVKDRGEEEVENIEEIEEVEAAEEPQENQSRRPSAEEIIEEGQRWLSQLFEKMQIDLKAEGELEDGDFIFNISGPDTKLLIGRSRQSPRVLSAVQTILSEKFGRDVRGRIEVDLGGFKQQRHKRLAEVATKLGEAARKVNRPLTIAGLNNYERRVIHQELASDQKIETESTDHGIFRKLRVLPK